MQGNKLKKLLCVALCASMLATSGVTVFAADSDVTAAQTETGKVTGSKGTSLQELSDMLNLVTYDQYISQYKDIPRGTETIVIGATDYDKEKTTVANVPIKSGVYGSKKDAVESGDAGTITWSFDVPKEGLYSVEFDFAPGTDRKMNIERIFSINGKVPFSQARSMSFTKTWMFDYKDNEETSRRFELDGIGNELRPDAKCDMGWNTVAFMDSDTYFNEPLLFYFKEGRNSVSLEGVRDTMYISELRITPGKETPTYEEVLRGYQEKGYTAGTASVHIDGETPSAVSNYTIYPNYDRSSAITEPQDPLLIMRNMIGGDKWQNTSEWVRYDFEIPQGGAGLYTVSVRFMQELCGGRFTSRTIRIDGEVPYAEAYGARFDYADQWQVARLGDGDNDFQFYLSEGKHTIEFMATLGDFGEILSRVKKISDSLNASHLEIMKLTGAVPDAYRDYGFARIMPEAIKNLSAKADELEDTLRFIEETTKTTNGSNSAIEEMIELLRLMSSDETEIAKNLNTLKTNISNLGSWVLDYEKQPLKIDYIDIINESEELPSAEANFGQSFKYQFDQFIGSFYADYNSFSSNEDEGEQFDRSLECWTSSGRDQTQIMRNLVEADFAKNYKTNVTLKLVDGAALLPSILAGIGPDISLDPQSSGVAGGGAAAGIIDYAIRGACLPLEGFDNFDEVMKQFDDSTVAPLSLYGHTYALPYSQSFPMMFVRTDVLTDLGIEIPKTWDDIMAMVPILQYNNMDIGIPNDYKMFLYQTEGGNMWDETSDNPMEWGWRVNFEDNITLSAFEDMCEMFTQYSLPISYNADTRFKDGYMPIIITNHSYYTSITIFAPEISGLWEMHPIPGKVDSNGNINNTAVATSSGVMMLKGCRDEQAAWDFLVWYTGKDFQVNYSQELVALLGESAKTTSANLAALEDMPWTKKEYEAIAQQMEHLVGITPYPGAYMIDRYTGFAFNNAYNKTGDPVELLLGYVNAINTEISRKRKEFNLPLYEDSIKKEE